MFAILLALFQKQLENPDEILRLLCTTQPDLTVVDHCVRHPNHVFELVIQLKLHLHPCQTMSSTHA